MHSGALFPRYQAPISGSFGACFVALLRRYQLAGGVTLEHRIKEPYSMWKKMERQGGGVDSVYDAVALRVVIKAKREAGETDEAHEEKSRQLCYHVRSQQAAFGMCLALCLVLL